MTEILMVLPDGTAEHGSEPLLRSRLKIGDWITATSQRGEPVQGEVTCIGDYKVCIDDGGEWDKKVYWDQIQAANMSQRQCRTCGCTHHEPCSSLLGPCAWTNNIEPQCTLCDDGGEAS